MANDAEESSTAEPSPNDDNKPVVETSTKKDPVVLGATTKEVLRVDI